MITVQHYRDDMICVKRPCGAIINRTIMPDTNENRDTLDRWISRKEKTDNN